MGCFWFGVGVLSLTLPESELKKLQAKHEQLEQSGDTENMLSIGLIVIPIADPKTGKNTHGTPHHFPPLWNNTIELFDELAAGG